MDVKTVCLGMLTDGEASGYDLKKHFESTFGHFFAAGYGSIYPALSSLLADGLVECTEIPQDGKPDRKVYRITPAGTAYLKTALDNPNPGHKVRSEFLATMCFAHLMSNDKIATLLDNRLAELDDYLSMFDELERSVACQWPAGKRFVCGFGRALTESTKKFIEDNRELAMNRAEDRRSIAG
jgi:DNA-binding PadR family transcriptional regulator